MQALVSRLPASRQLDHPPVRQRQPQRRLTAEQIEQLVAEYQAGASMQTLATRWGLNRTTVAEHLRRGGAALRRQGVPNDKRTEMIQLHGEGWSCRRGGRALQLRR